MSHDTKPLQRFSRQRALVIMGIAAVLVVATLVFNSIRTATVQEVTVLRIMPGPQLGVVINQDRVIVHIESGSAAAAAAVQVGDTLVALADRPLTSLADLKAVTSNLSTDVVVLTLQRGDARPRDENDEEILHRVTASSPPHLLARCIWD